ncbi:MAG: hypothetical protein ABFD18_20715 [Syntrophomonas sp.]
MIIMAIGFTGCKSLGEEEKQVSSTPEVGIPLIMMVPDGTEDSKQKALLAHWNLKEGKLSLQEEPLFTEKKGNEDFPRLVWDGGSTLFACSFGTQETGGLAEGKVEGFSIQNVRVDYNPITIADQGSSRQGELLLAYSKKQFSNSSATEGIIIEIHQGDKVEKSELRLPDFVSSGEVIPLLISGTPNHFTVLALCQSRIVVAEVQGKQISWKKVEGTNGGIVAGAGANLAKSGDKIYTTEPILSVINLKNQNLKLEDFKAGTSLLAGLTQNMEKARAKYDEVYPERRFGTYNDVLLMAFNLPDEQWIWAIRNDESIGYLYFNSENKTLQISHGNNMISQANLSTQPIGFMLPRDGYGQYK